MSSEAELRWEADAALARARYADSAKASGTPPAWLPSDAVETALDERRFALRELVRRRRWLRGRALE